MDVRCERCKTEYEFDDARITEAGVTVKCTQCSHVFKVKKKALLVNVPVKPDEIAGAEAAANFTAAPTPAREWKVRQASGNTFTFKELTTLQKWIVERKVARDDEISVNGATWKRLGDIAELSAFFQVTDDAYKAAQLQALQAAQAQLPPARSTTPPPGRIFTPPPASAPASMAAPTPQPVQAVVFTSSPTYPVAVVQPQGTVVPVVAFPAGAAPAAVEASAPAAPLEPARSQPSTAVRTAMRADAKKGGAGWVIALVVVALLGGGGYAGYTSVWLPREKQRHDAVQAATALTAEAARAEREREEQQRLADEERAAAAQADAEKKAAEEAAKLAAAQQAVAAPEAIDGAAPQPAPVNVVPAKAEASGDAAGERAVAASKGPPRDFDWYMAQGDRLRERERFEKALDAYGSAADLQPDRVEPITGRALVLLDMGNRLQAEAGFQQALKVNPRYAVAVMGLAETYRMLGKKEEAIRYYERYLELLPDGPEATVARSALERLKH